MITIQSKRRKRENIEKDFPNAVLIDVTSKGTLPMVKFSPFYPVGDIPIPFSSGLTSQSVEGIWQGLKVFADHDIDTTKFTVTNMKGLKRTVRKFGICQGHRQGVNGSELLDYITARKHIYLPAYEWVLQHKLSEEMKELKRLAACGDVVLLDYETNEDIDNPKKPLSHAALIKKALEKI